MKTIICIVVNCVFLINCIGQKSANDFSAPIDIKQEGVNKVLCMHSGRTFLFHMEAAEPILIKVFDSTHKEVANQKITSRLVDISGFKQAIFQGLFEINGEVLLFIETRYQYKNNLIRLRFNGDDGALKEETCLESARQIDNVYRTVVHCKDEDNYQILSCTDIPQFEKCDVHVNFFNKNHEITKSVPLVVERKNYDRIDILNAESASNGLNVLLNFLKISQNATSSTSAGRIGSPTIYDHFIGIYFLPKDSNVVLNTTVDLSTNTYPFYAFYGSNPISNALNILVLSYKESIYHDGLQPQLFESMKQMFIKMDHRNLSHFNVKQFEMSYANYYMKSQLNKNASFEGLPIKVFTNESGESSVISLEYNRQSESAGRIGNLFSYIRNIAVTRLDGGNSETAAIVLPMNQAFNSRTNFYNPYDLSQKKQTQKLFTTTDDTYNRQFVSINAFVHDHNVFIVYNDDSRNFDNSIAKPGDTVYDFRTTQAYYYKVTEANSVTKNLLFGESVPGEFRNVFIEGADYDENRNTYVALARCQSGKNTLLRMSWSRLE